MRAGDDADLATPARIRRAAIELFGSQGFGIGLRAIAEEAGVSLGLIRHHFGSKDGLRAACDDYVLSEIKRLKEEQAHAENPAAEMLQRLAQLDDYAPLVSYMSRALSAGGRLATEFLERMVEDAEIYMQESVDSGLIVPSVDERARARFLVLAVVGGMHLDAVLSADPPHQAWRNWTQWSTLPALELYTQGLFADRSMLDAYLAYAKDPPETERTRDRG